MYSELADNSWFVPRQFGLVFMTCEDLCARKNETATYGQGGCDLRFPVRAIFSISICIHFTY